MSLLSFFTRKNDSQEVIRDLQARLDAQAKLIHGLRSEIAAKSMRTSRTTANEDAITQVKRGYYTLEQYAKRRNIEADMTYRVRMGRYATKFSKHLKKQAIPLTGATINGSPKRIFAYHVSALDSAYAIVRAS